METIYSVDPARPVQSLKSRLSSNNPGPLPDRPIPIALVITDLDVGGAERALVALATRLDRRLWNPSIVCLGPEGALATILRTAGLNVICLNSHRRRPIAAILQLVQVLRKIRPVLIQSFLFHANLAVKLAAPLAGRPWVIGGIRVAEREKTWHRKLDRITQHLSSGSVCVSEGVRQFSIDVGGISTDRLMTIPNGVELADFDCVTPVDRGALGLRAEDRIALFVGRLTMQKGVPVLLDAFSKIADDRPEWRLLIAGDGEDRQALESHAESLGDRVKFLGRRDDVPSLMKTADLFVLPSLWEGMPNVILEAMAAGRAVCVTDVEGTAELVDEQTGWIARVGDPIDLEARLREATADEAVRERMGIKSREKIAREFTHEAVVAAYERLWFGVLAIAVVAPS